MTSPETRHEAYVIVTLGVYVVAAIVVVALRVHRSRLSASVCLFYAIERIYVGLMFQWRANRRCPFPSCGPAIIYANHRSPVDPMLVWMNHHLGSRFRRVRIIRFMMAREYYEIPIVHWICRVMYAIPVERAGKDMRPTHQALEFLRQGHWLGLFPEGRINTGSALLPADTGMAWLALHARVPVYPVFLQNSPQSLSMIKPFYTPSRVRVTYGDPVDLSGFYERRITHCLLEQVTELLMLRLARLGDVEYASPEPSAGRLAVLCSEDRKGIASSAGSVNEARGPLLTPQLCAERT